MNTPLVALHRTAYECPVNMAAGFEEMACRSSCQAISWNGIDEAVPGYSVGGQAFDAFRFRSPAMTARRAGS